MRRTVGHVCGVGETHKSLNGKSFAMPPRTMNTATAKFTMRLHIVSLSNTRPMPRAKLLPSSHEASRSRNSQDIGEVHGGVVEMWEPQLGDWYPGTVRRMGGEWDDGKKTPFTVMLLLGIVGTAQHETRPQPRPSQELGPTKTSWHVWG